MEQKSSLSMSQVVIIFFVIYIVIVSSAVFIIFVVVKPALTSLSKQYTQSEKVTSDKTTTTVPSNKVQFNRLINQSSTDYASGQFDDGMAKANQALPLAETNDDKAIAHYWIGLFYYRKTDLNKSESEENQAITLKPDYAAAYTTLSAISMSRDDNKKATNNIIKFIRIGNVQSIRKENKKKDQENCDDQIVKSGKTQRGLDFIWHPAFDNSTLFKLPGNK